MIAVAAVNGSHDVATVLTFGLVAVAIIVVAVCMTAIEISGLRSRERIERWKIDHEIYKQEQGK